MKILTAILSIYFLGLTFVPCTDSVSEETHSVSIEQHHSDHEKHLDLCAPFCECQCCQSLVVVENHFPSEIPNPHTEQLQISFAENLKNGFSDFPLQPPQA